MASTIILSDNGVSSGSAGYKVTAGTDGVLILQSTTSGGTATNAVYVDNKQNIGFQVTPAAWVSSVKAIQLGARTSLFQYNGATTDLMNNGYFDGTDYRYLETATATFYRQSTGRHQFYCANSGTGGDPIAWTNVIQVEKDYTLALQGATSTSGTGIAFPATQSASTNANTLDDYEEGTWTPTLRGSGTAGTFNLATATGKYTKVGNMVTLYCAITVTSISGSPTGDLQIQGLPFTSAAGTSANGACQSQLLGIASNTPCVSFSTRGTSTTLYVSYVNGSQANSVAQANAVSGSAIIDFCISYPV